MEKAKISAKQLFVLIILFELGSSLLVIPGQSAEQDAWIAILAGTAGGLVLFLMHHFFYQLDPKATAYKSLFNVLGKPLGWAVSFLYIIYYAYIAARILRDFGEMLFEYTAPFCQRIVNRGVHLYRTEGD